MGIASKCNIALKQEEGGLGLSSFACMLCDADKSKIQTRLGSFSPMNRSIVGLHQAGLLALVNPDKLNRVQVDAVLRGSKTVMPLTEGSQKNKQEILFLFQDGSMV